MQTGLTKDEKRMNDKEEAWRRAKELINMNKYERLIKDLETNGWGTMKVFGNSMTPLLKSGSTLAYAQFDKYEKGDIVFCKVKGRYIDAHLITAVDAEGRYLISNNHGHDNGWTKQIYGKVVGVLSN